jgi:hypothetical protein
VPSAGGGASPGSSAGRRGRSVHLPWTTALPAPLELRRFRSVRRPKSPARRHLWGCREREGQWLKGLDTAQRRKDTKPSRAQRGGSPEERAGAIDAPGQTRMKPDSLEQRPTRPIRQGDQGASAGTNGSSGLCSSVSCLALRLCVFVLIRSSGSLPLPLSPARASIRGCYRSAIGVGQRAPSETKTTEDRHLRAVLQAFAP